MDSRADPVDSDEVVGPSLGVGPSTAIAAEVKGGSGMTNIGAWTDRGSTEECTICAVVV